MLAGPAGLVVVDTGRHPWHSNAILAFAASRRQPLTAIVNTHWHLDHSSGNRRLKAAHPEARVYTTTAVDRALAPGGFIARSLATARAQPPAPDAPPTRQEETALFLATMETPGSLRPDVAIEASGPERLAGRPLSVRVAYDAVTDADVWIYDESTRVAVLGDRQRRRARLTGRAAWARCWRAMAIAGSPAHTRATTWSSCARTAAPAPTAV